ncbi:universal stress protein [Novipirellula sp. SH528]|uniref:universal stress protein n=1 Tax=Novipirellula sp. SH528 TaxID=3454466 RepID=UPI003F9FED04
MKVLLASDGSPLANNAAQLLHHLDFQRQLKLAVLTVSLEPELSVHGNPQNLEREEQEQQFVARHHAELEELFADQCQNYFSKLHQTGNVAKSILEVSRRIVADLIVIGAVGHSLVTRMLLGSISDRVATHAQCSVLVVRPPDKDHRPHVCPKKITIAYDGSLASREAINEMMSLKWDPDCEFSVLSVAPSYDYLMSEGVAAGVLEDEAKALEQMKGKAEYMAKQISETLPNTHPHVVSCQHEGEAIVRFSEHHQSDLVILGDTGHSLLHDVFLGSTTKYVLRHAPCSVWISRHHHTTESD